MLVIGLTGGIGCGKSTVCNLLRNYDDTRVFDSDEEAKNILLSKDFRPKAIQILGTEALRDGWIDTEKTAAIIFNDEQRRKQLELALHPLVFLEMKSQMILAEAADIDIFVIESAILFETRLNEYCDGTVAVTCNYPEQIRRLTELRGMTVDDAKLRISVQMPEQARNNLADLLIGTDCQLDEVRARVKYMHNYLIKTYS